MNSEITLDTKQHNTGLAGIVFAIGMIERRDNTCGMKDR